MITQAIKLEATLEAAPICEGLFILCSGIFKRHGNFFSIVTVGTSCDCVDDFFASCSFGFISSSCHHTSTVALPADCCNKYGASKVVIQGTHPYV